MAKKPKTKAQKAAAKRHKKFKQTRVQTFGGKKTNFSDAEKKRITDAGYSVKGYSSAPAQSNTQLQVNLDNRKYGNTVPTGSFSISEAGRAQAEANKKEAAAKAAAAKAAADKKEATRKRTFDPNRLSSTFSDSFTGLKGLGSFQNYGYRAPVYKPGNQMRFGIPYKDPGKTGTLGNFGNWFDKGVNKRIGNEARIGFGTALSDDFSQMGKFKNVRTGKLESGLLGTGIPKNFNQLKQTFQGEGGFGFSFGKGADTGPTGIQRMLVRRFLPYAGQISLGKDIFNQGATDSATANLMNNINTSVANLTGGRLNSPGNNPETDIGAQTWQGIKSIPGKVANLFGGDDTKVASTDAGGLNIGGGVDSEEGFGNSNTGRVLNDIGNTINTYKGIFNDASAIKNAVAPKPKFATFREDAAEQAALNEANNFTPNSADVRSDLKSLFASGKNYKDVAGTLSDTRAVVEGGAEAFKNLSESQQKNLVNSAGGIIDNSKVFESFGKKYTGSDTFKDQTQDTLAAFNKTIQEASQDTKGRVDPINNLLKNFNNIEGYGTTSRFLNTLNDPNFVNTRQQIQAAYDPTSPKAKALSAEDRGIVGSAGNLLIGGKLSDVFKANNPTERGTTFTPTDTANLVANSMIAANTPGSLTQKRFGEIGALTGQGTEVTAGSLIRGTLPRGRRSNNVSNLGGSSRQPALQTAPAAVQQEYPLPIIPQTGVVNNNLQNIQQNAYNNQMSMYMQNPNYFAQFMPQQRFPRRGRFRSAFSRDYFN